MTTNELRKHVKGILKEMLQIKEETPEDEVTPEQDVEGEVEPEPESDSEPESKATDEETGEALYTVETMIKLFNAIRSGSSMKDENVVKNLNSWWDKAKLEDLKKFLSALANVAQIVSKSEAEDSPEQELETEPAPEETPDDAAALDTEEL